MTANTQMLFCKNTDNKPTSDHLSRAAQNTGTLEEAGRQTPLWQELKYIKYDSFKQLTTFLYTSTINQSTVSTGKINNQHC